MSRQTRQIATHWRFSPQDGSCPEDSRALQPSRSHNQSEHSDSDEDGTGLPNTSHEYWNLCHALQDPSHGMTVTVRQGDSKFHVLTVNWGTTVQVDDTGVGFPQITCTQEPAFACKIPLADFERLKDNPSWLARNISATDFQSLMKVTAGCVATAKPDHTACFGVQPGRRLRLATDAETHKPAFWWTRLT